MIKGIVTNGNKSVNDKNETKVEAKFPPEPPIVNNGLKVTYGAPHRGRNAKMDATGPLGVSAALGAASAAKNLRSIGFIIPLEAKFSK